MTDKTVKAFLRYHHANVVDLALEMVQLDRREREAVELCGRQRLTLEEAAEVAGVSTCTMQERWAKARQRLAAAWSGLDWVETLAEKSLN